MLYLSLFPNANGVPRKTDNVFFRVCRVCVYVCVCVCVCVCLMDRRIEKTLFALSEVGKESGLPRESESKISRSRVVKK